MYYLNNKDSNFIIINLKVIELNSIFSYADINNRIHEWLKESLLIKYNKNLNWNIAIIYPESFYLITHDLNNTLNKEELLHTKIIKILLYIDNNIYSNINSVKLIYTDNNNNNNNNNNNQILSLMKLKNYLDINSKFLFLEKEHINILELISISGVNKKIILQELDILKLGNKYYNHNYIENFIYLKNIQKNGIYTFINCNNGFNNFLENLINNTNE